MTDAPIREIRERPLWRRMAEAIEGSPYYQNGNDRISAYLRAGIRLGKIDRGDFLEADAIARDYEQERRKQNS
jgi:hypothetical protein